MRILYLAPTFLFAAVAILFLVISRSDIPSRSEAALDNPAVHSHQRTVHSQNAIPLSTLYQPPQNVQDLVNRYDAVFTGTITEISSPVLEKPYDWQPEDDSVSKRYGIPLPRMRVTYYAIQIEDVLLDDGNIRLHPRLGLTGGHNSMRPQVGERFLFALGRQPDGLSYGLTADWCLIFLDGGPIRNFDGVEPGYAGVANEASLKSAVQAAVPNRVHLPMAQWPIQAKWLADENAPVETPQPPGGDGPGDSGPVGNANQ